MKKKESKKERKKRCDTSWSKRKGAIMAKNPKPKFIFPKDFEEAHKMGII